MQALNSHQNALLARLFVSAEELSRHWSVMRHRGLYLPCSPEEVAIKLDKLGEDMIGLSGLAPHVALALFFSNEAYAILKAKSANQYWFWTLVSNAALIAQVSNQPLPLTGQHVEAALAALKSNVPSSLAKLAAKPLADLAIAEAALLSAEGLLVVEHKDGAAKVSRNPLFA